MHVAVVPRNVTLTSPGYDARAVVASCARHVCPPISTVELCGLNGPCLFAFGTCNFVLGEVPPRRRGPCGIASTQLCTNEPGRQMFSPRRRISKTDATKWEREVALDVTSVLFVAGVFGM